MTDSKNSLCASDLQLCVETLNRLTESPHPCLAAGTTEKQVADAAALLLRRIKAAQKRESRVRDREVVAQASIRAKRTEKEYGRYLTSDSESVDDSGIALSKTRVCYVCKQRYRRLHHFYDAMCGQCGDWNYEKRRQTAELGGRTFLVTGGRIKIGFQIARKLLRAGADVMVTSRFPYDAAYRYSLESDHGLWIDRLRIHATDFRSIPSVDRLCEQIQRENSCLDGLINNAAQTVRRPPEYYRHLIEHEVELGRTLPDRVAGMIVMDLEEDLEAGPDSGPDTDIEKIAHSGLVIGNGASLAPAAMMTQVPVLAEDQRYDPSAFPLGQYDADGQQIDARDENSWTMPIAAVSVGELLEVHAINSLVPFLLIQRLESLLMASPHADRYIVNVSAMEGQLNTHAKAHRHPHTNMAKAGMNMVTRTCAEEFASRGIFMNSVDTGWITNEFPMPRTQEMQDEGFEPPLDEIDGAARVLDPVFVGVGSGNRSFGKFLKDYREVAW